MPQAEDDQDMNGDAPWMSALLRNKGKDEIGETAKNKSFFNLYNISEVPSESDKQSSHHNKSRSYDVNQDTLKISDLDSKIRAEGITKKTRNPVHQSKKKKVDFDMDEDFMKKYAGGSSYKYRSSTEPQYEGNDSKIKELSRLLGDENVIKGLKFLGLLAEYLEECPEI